MNNDKYTTIIELQKQLQNVDVASQPPTIASRYYASISSVNESVLAVHKTYFDLDLPFSLHNKTIVINMGKLGFNEVIHNFTIGIFADDVQIASTTYNSTIPRRDILPLPFTITNNIIVYEKLELRFTVNAVNFESTITICGIIL